MSEHHPNQRLTRALSAAIGLGAAALAGAVVIVNGQSGLPGAAADPSTPTSTSVTATSSAAFPADEYGYVSTAARCDDGQILMAYGRTSRSLVAICVDRDGELEYRGVRLSDEASIVMPATRGTDGAVIADRDGVTYSVTSTTFLIAEGDTALYRAPWTEFHQPRFSPAGTAATSSTATSTAASSTGTTSTSSTENSVTTTVSTTTVTITPTTSKPGG
jgi:hypothetical protein